MKKRIFTCVALVSLPFLISEAHQPAAETVAYIGARIIDGSGAAPIENAVLVVRQGRIAAVGPAGTTIPTGASRVDVGGKTIIPGLINTHGHITDVRGLKGSPEFYTPEQIKHQLETPTRRLRPLGRDNRVQPGRRWCGGHPGPRRASARSGAAVRGRPGRARLALKR